MSNWTTDKPTAAGDYWLSFAPKYRAGTILTVVRCRVYAWEFDNPGKLRVKLDEYGFRPLDSICFDGAQWMPVEQKPSDPFAEQPRDNSRDSDLS